MKRHRLLLLLLALLAGLILTLLSHSTVISAGTRTSPTPSVASGARHSRPAAGAMSTARPARPGA